MPPERVSALRRAFGATMKDPEFLAEAARAHLDIEPLTGERIQELLDGAYAARSDREQVAALVSPAAQTKK